MNNKIKLAVAGSVLALSAGANAGIVIPAGEWTLDIGGNMNTFANFSDTDRAAKINGGMAGYKNTSSARQDDRDTSITTGLLPNVFSVTGTTRQNDIDVSFTWAINPGSAQDSAASLGSGAEHRQAFLTFGDKSWGTFKVGKDLGVFGAGAILNDMTLLGVGGGHVNRSATTTLGGIGTGYIYADWKSQISYTTPNMNGFQATLAVVQPWDSLANYGVEASDTASGTLEQSHKNPGYEFQAQYAWQGDVAGKVWVDAMWQDHDDVTSYTISGGALGTNHGNYDAEAYGVGAALNMGNFNLVGYYYDAEGVGTTFQNYFAFDVNTAGKIKERDSDGGYLQATYVIPTGTKLGVAYGVSNLDRASGETKANASALVESNERWTIGAYHPLTKHLNLVAEYSDFKTEAHGVGVKDNESDVFSLGAILFF